MELKNASIEYKFVRTSTPNIFEFKSANECLLQVRMSSNMATPYVLFKCMSPTLGCSEQLEQVNLMGYPFIVF